MHIAVPPNLLGFVRSAGLAAVAYGPDSQQQVNAATDFVRHVQNPISALPEIIARVTQVWEEKSTTLTALAHDADLLLAGMNEQRLAANVAEYYGIPLAALHFFPPQVWLSGPLFSPITQAAAAAQRRALGLPEATEHNSLEIQAYDELCLPGVAANRRNGTVVGPLSAH